MVDQIDNDIVSGTPKRSEQSDRGLESFLVTQDPADERGDCITHRTIGRTHQQVDTTLRVSFSKGAQHRHADQNIPDPLQADEQNARCGWQVEEVFGGDGDLAGERTVPRGKKRPAPAELERFQRRRRQTHLHIP